MASRLKVAVVVATTGRPDVLPMLISRLADQTTRPDIVIISAVTAADVGDIQTGHPEVRLIYGRKGLCAQRNRALESLAPDLDVIVFFDDDFVPSIYWLETLLDVMDSHPDIACVTGHVLADGIKGPGISPDEGLALIQRFDQALAPRLEEERRSMRIRPVSAPYGCNMAFRRMLVADLRFDERLPLYGWQEDRDFGHFAGRRGRRVWISALHGAHLGVKSGRTNGLRFGASQILNPLYMLGKGSMSPLTAARFMGSNFAANLLGSIRPEPHVDRRGRLRGNLVALGQVLRGRIEPEVVERL